jgi:hypothetical protein
MGGRRCWREEAGRGEAATEDVDERERESERKWHEMRV